jgi:hypothetical protein
MALAKGSLLLFFLGRGSLILFLAGAFSFSLGEAQWTAPRYSNSFSPFSTVDSLISNSARAGLPVPMVRLEAASAEVAAVSAKLRDPRSAHA